MENHDNSQALVAVSNVFLIDWLTVTFKDMTPDRLIMMLGLTGEEWTEKQSFKNGFDDRLLKR